MVQNRRITLGETEMQLKLNDPLFLLIHRFFYFVLIRGWEIERLEKITKFRHKIAMRTIMPDVLCYLLIE